MKNHNVDAREIEKFGSPATDWWDRGGRMKSLHDINPLRVGYIDGRVDLKEKKVLDVGCGGGILSEAMAEKGARVTGIDMGELPLSAAREHLAVSGWDIRYRKMSVEEMAREKPGAFDVVTCLELLEHVPDPASVVASCARLLKPGGDLFFATLNRNFKSFIFAVVGAEYVLRLLPAGTHNWKKFVTPEELSAWALKAGLTRENFSGMGYNPFTRVYFSGTDTSVNYLAHFSLKPCGD